MAIRKILQSVKEDYPSDIDRIVKVFLDHGYEIDRDTANKAWSTYSYMFAATWLFLPDDDNELFNIVMQNA